MPNTICAYEGCSNSKRTKPSLNFHRFPKHEERRTQWILRTGNLALLDMSESAMENRRLCAEHFSDDDVKYISKGSKILKDTALPMDHSLLSTDDEVSQNVTHKPIDDQPVASNIDYNDSKIPARTSHNLQLPIVSEKQDPPVVHADRPSISTSQNDTHEDDELVTKLQAQLAAANKRLNLLKNAIAISHQKEVDKLKNKVLRYQKIVKGQSKKIKNLEKKLRKNEEEATFHKNLKQLNKSVLDFFRMQVNHVKLTKWTDEEKQFSIALYQKSPKAYSYLRDEKEFALPCVTLIQRWNNELVNSNPEKSDN